MDERYSSHNAYMHCTHTHASGNKNNERKYNQKIEISPERFKQTSLFIEAPAVLMTYNPRGSCKKIFVKRIVIYILFFFSFNFRFSSFSNFTHSSLRFCGTKFDYYSISFQSVYHLNWIEASHKVLATWAVIYVKVKAEEMSPRIKFLTRNQSKYPWSTFKPRMKSRMWILTILPG